MVGRRTLVADWAMRILIVAFVTVVVTLPFHAFISTWGGTSIGPLLIWKSWKELLLTALVPVVILYCVLRPDVAKKVWDSWLLRLIAVYVVLHLLYAWGSQASFAAVIAGLMMNLRFLAMFVVGYLIATSKHPWVTRLWKWAPPAIFTITIVLSLMAIAQVAFLPKDFLTHFGYGTSTIMPYTVLDDQPDALRAFATLRGPNPLGAYLLICLAVCAVFIAKQRRNIFAGISLGLGAVALVLTSSRSAWLGAGAACAVLVFSLVPVATVLKWVKWWWLPSVVVLVGFFWAAVTIPALRLAVFHSTIDRTTLTTGSSDKHWTEVTNGLIDVSSSPFGQGVGTAGPASYYNTNNHPKIAENYFIQLAQELGVIGVALFILLNGMVITLLWERRRDAWAKALLASFVGITVINLFLHGWADDPTAMTWWAIAGLYLSSNVAARKK
ncbi:MAG TPA: O-antigen ligase family protein [Candidatus Saccharimonadales bacterium]|nr:O-antigen ligase family protein [Candidatus Saccharimonadales bacterium]